MKSKLTIQEYKPEIEEQEVEYKWGPNYYDLKTGILIRSIYTEKELSSNIIYDFTFDNGNDVDTYHYVVVKTTTPNNYLISEFDPDKLYYVKNKSPLRGFWFSVNNFEKEFNISFDEIKNNIINSDKLH